MSFVSIPVKLHLALDKYHYYILTMYSYMPMIALYITRNNGIIPIGYILFPAWFKKKIRKTVFDPFKKRGGCHEKLLTY